MSVSCCVCILSAIEKPLNARLRCDNHFHRKVMNYTMTINYDVKSAWWVLLFLVVVDCLFFVSFVGVANCIAFVDHNCICFFFVCFLRRSKIAGRANILVFVQCPFVVLTTARLEIRAAITTTPENRFYLLQNGAFQLIVQFFLSTCFRRLLFFFWLSSERCSWIS